jgi:copper chaperone CopZ
MTTIQLNVSGMKCGGCENSLKDALGAQAGVTGVRPSHKEARVEIDFDESQVDPAQLKKIIVDQGFKVAD